MKGKSVTLLAPAKINLSLAVTGLRTDGYHQLETVFQSISLYDEIKVELKGEGISCNCGKLSGRENLAYKAAQVFLASLRKKENFAGYTGIRITIEKKIPLEAGLAGGSTDAAAVLKALNRLYNNPFSYKELLEQAASCGADTAFFLKGGTQWGEGIGSTLEELPAAPFMELVLVKPARGVNTFEAYRLFDRIGEFSQLNKSLWIQTLQNGKIKEIGKILVNSLEKPAFVLVPEIKRIKNILTREACQGVLMSGSGSAVFGILPDKNSGTRIRKILTDEGFIHNWQVQTITGCPV